MLNLQPVRFGIVGLGNTAIGLLLIYAAKWLGLGDVSANLIGYGICIGVSFALNKRWTFRHSGATRSAFIRYLVVVLAAYMGNLVTVMLFIHIASTNRYLAQAAGIPAYTLINFFGSKFFAFRQPTASEDVDVESRPPNPDSTGA